MVKPGRGQLEDENWCDYGSVGIQKQTRYTVKVDPKEGSTAKPKFYYPRTSALQKVP